MKVLVVAVPAAGHLNPLQPLLAAFIGGGDQVAIATSADAAPLVEASGAEFFPAGRGELAWLEQLKARIRGNPGDGLAPERINHYFLPRLFGEIATDDMIDDVLACGRGWGPDLVLFETYALVGPLAADMLGVPGVHHLIGPIPDREVFELVDDAVSPLWRSFGRDSPGYGGVFRGLNIEISPPSLSSIRVPSGERLSLRPSSPLQTTATRGERPLVYVTFGTFFNAEVDLFRAALDGLAGEPVDVVVTVGADQDPAALAPIPANARVERFIPQATLLPACAAVVHHAGSGTTFGALAHGLPQVVVPQGADNFLNAETLERAGVAVVLRPGEFSADNLRGALRRILDEPSYGTAARRAAAEIAAMPGPSEVADAVRSRYGDPVSRN